MEPKESACVSLSSTVRSLRVVLPLICTRYTHARHVQYMHHRDVVRGISRRAHIAYYFEVQLYE